MTEEMRGTLGIRLKGPLRVAPAVTVLSLTTLFGLASTRAQAEPPRLLSYGTFGKGQLTFPTGIAVDQSSGHVYVSGLLNESNINFTANVNAFGASGNLLSTFGEGGYGGVAVNPTNGDVDALREPSFGEPTRTPVKVYTYDPSGELVGEFEVPPSGNALGRTVVQIATDSAGNVYVPVVPENKVVEYSPAGAEIKTFTGSGNLSGPTGVTVDPFGNVWVADAGHNRIVEFDPSTGEVLDEIKSEGVTAVALNGRGDVFAVVYRGAESNGADSCGTFKSPCARLVEYSSATGMQLADVGAGKIGTLLEAPQNKTDMVAVNDSTGRVYVTDGGDSLVWVFGPPTAPVAGSELTAEVGASEAKLGALVNPGGIGTRYRFEYGPTTAYGQATPFPEGSVGAGIVSRTVWAAATGLAPGTTYHYRVMATNELGTVAGPDQTFTTQTGAEASCANEQFRTGFSARLPDCRGYELVTPVTDTSAQPVDPLINGVPGPIVAARHGDRMAYSSAETLPGSQSGGMNYVATRGPSGWSSENVIPLQSYTADRCTLRDSAMKEYSSDLLKGVLWVGGEQVQEAGQITSGCGAEAVEVVTGEPAGYENLLLRNEVDASYRLINVDPSRATPANAQFQGASADLSHVVFSESAKLTENAPGGVEDLYEWDEGVLRLVTVLPNGAPVVGSLARRHEGTGVMAHAVFDEGSDVVFTTGGDLYLREHAEQPPSEECAAPSAACTVQLDSPQQGGGKGPGGGGSFQDASAEGSQVFFTDDASAGLTGDTKEGSGTNLYRYELGKGLTDLTPAGNAAVKEVIDISEDGSYVYFVASGKLAAGATEGRENLYLYHDGTTTVVATPTIPGGAPAAQVSPSGAFLAFTSQTSVPTVSFPQGYDNVDQATGTPDPEIYLYSAASNEVACASCNPSGEAPTSGGATMQALDIEAADGAPHYVSDGGRVFFDTADVLLPSDTNGQTNVYEYENGQLHLISTGTSASRSLFLDASDRGEDVFFLTRQALVRRDTNEEALSIYDARVEGGLPEPLAPTPCTRAETCRVAASPQPSIYAAPSSQTFSGEGNVTPPPATSKKITRIARCEKGFVKKKVRKTVRCVKAKCKKDLVKKRGKCVVRHERKGKKKHRAKKGSVRS